MEAARTWNTDPQRRDRIANATLGLAGEVGEVVEPIKKHLFHGRSLDIGNLTKELGDVLYYVAILADELGITLEDVATTNTLKLRERYPNGFRTGSTDQPST
jgi:NTP pyrophosphatase (non-canonical NTP hydrolase)